MIQVQFERNWEDRHEDPSGRSTRQYPRGIVIKVPPERALYLLAVGYAIAVGTLSDDETAAVAELRQVVNALRDLNIEPTIEAVYMTYNEALQASHAAAGQQTASTDTDTEPDVADATSVADDTPPPATGKRGKVRTSA